MAKTVNDLASAIWRALREGTVTIEYWSIDPLDPGLDVIKSITIKDRDGQLPLLLVADLTQQEGSVDTITFNFPAPEDEGEVGGGVLKVAKK